MTLRPDSPFAWWSTRGAAGVNNPIQALVEQGVADRVFPGAAYAVGTRDQILMGFAGSQTYDPESPRIDRDTLWDLASLTKVVATTSVIAGLEREGRLRLDQRVAEFVPEFGTRGKDTITVRDVLLHESGMAAHRNLWELAPDAESGWRRVLDDELVYPPRSRTEYSCLGFMVLYWVASGILAGADAPMAARGAAFRAWLHERVWEPLHMESTDYLPSPNLLTRCAPTEVRRTGYRDGLVHGEVHDENCAFLGGVSGNAGLFSTIADLARFGRSLVRNDGVVYGPYQLERFLARAHPDTTRALGWDTKSPEGSSAGSLFGPDSYGHTGFTGTSLWIDPDHRVFAVLLTNRVHPTRDHVAIQDFRPVFHDVAFSAHTVITWS